MILLISFVGVLIIGFVVFGGGQVFMPLFKWLWLIMAHAGADISDQTSNQFFAIANSTPGVISTKLAVFTGYLAANGAWWGWIALFITYLIFTLPAMIAIIYATKMVNKLENFNHLKGVILILKPVIAGIVIALALQILLRTMIPTVVFNDVGQYIGTRSTIFKGWRLIAIIIYSIVVAIEAAYLYSQKVNLFKLVVINLVIGLIIFQPWLMS